MNKQNTRCLIVWIAATVIIAAQTVKAVGFRLPNQDPEAIARGNAFVATADDPSAIYYNPAGITQLTGQNVRAGLYLVSGGYDYTSPTGVKASDNSDFQPVPQLYYVMSPENLPVSFGLGLYAPYGLSVDWGNHTPFRTAGENGDLLYLTINPVVAWQVLPHLSIAIGPTINYSKANFERGIGLLPGDQFKLSGDGWDYGFNAGLFWQPHEKWAFGINYRYATEVNYQGTSQTLPSPPFPHETSSSASLRFPQYIVGGVSFRPTEKWNFEFDLDWTDWDNVNEIAIKHTGFGNVAWPLHYTSSFMYEFGVTRKLPKGFFVSLGYFYSENSAPDSTFNPLIADTDLHLGSVGFGHKGKRWDWAFGYQVGYSPGREVKNDLAFPQAEGTYHVLNHGLNIAATLKF